jgi:putative peptidoglycan lipid II flippase
MTQSSEPSKGEKKQAVGGRSVGGQALIMSLGTFSSRWLGLVRESLLAYFFDRMVTDAWITAFRVPNFFRRLLGEGSLSVSFIPVFTDLRVQAPDISSEGGPSVRVRNFINGFYTLLLLILSTITVFGVLYPEFFIWILVDQASFRQIPGKYELTLRLTRVMFGFVFFISSFAYFMGILNALGKFGWAALAPLFFNIAMIVSTMIPGAWFPQPGDGLAWGVLIGGGLQALVLIPQLVRMNYAPQLTLKLWSPEIARVFRNMVPGLFGMSLMQVTLVVNTRFASALGEGAISYIYWADRLLELPLSLISVSLGTALLPSLSSSWARGDRAEYSQTGHFYLRLNLYLSMACAIGLFILARPVIEILFQRGHFTEGDSIKASQVLWIYAFAMIPTSCVRILGPFYFAVKNTWYPALVSALGLGLHLILAPYLMAQYGLQGLNVSTLLSAGLNFGLLLVGLPWLTTHFDLKKLVIQTGKFIVCGIPLALGLQSYFFMATSADSFFYKAASLILASLIGGGLFALASRGLRLEEYDLTVGRLLKRVGSRPP